MKTITYSLLAAATLFAASCSSNEGGTSTPVDSTNQTGSAPVNYQEGTPAETVPGNTLQSDAVTSDTTGRQPATGIQPNGSGANSSNTTDARTTSGSANNGDADGDRKR